MAIVLVERGIHLLPIAILILLPSTILITYSIALSLKHVTPSGLPYISDTGTYSPESCVFGQLLNMIAFLIAVFVHTRFNHIKIFIDVLDDISKLFCQRMNMLSLICGIMAAFGLTLVANFQETNVIIVHVIGAYLIFGVGGFYLLIQTYFTYKLHIITTNAIRCMRVISNIITCVAFTMVTFGAILAGRNPLEIPAHHKWTPGTKGYIWHLTSVISEWFLAFSFLLYMSTFVSEFKALEWNLPQIKIKIEYEPLLSLARSNLRHNINRGQLYSDNYIADDGDFITIATSD